MCVQAIDKGLEGKIMGVSVNVKTTPADGEKIKLTAEKCVSLNSKRLMEAWILMNTAPCLHKRFRDDEIFDVNSFDLCLS